VEIIQRDYVLPPEVEVVDGGVSGMELLDYVAGVDHLIIIDAIRAGQGAGEVVRLTDDQIPKVFRLKLSPHHVGLSDVFAAARLTGEEPKTMVALGVEPVSLELSMELTPDVAEKLPRVIDMALDELRSLGLEVRRKE
jgi:hydrogenase maturation protease